MRWALRTGVASIVLLLSQAAMAGMVVDYPQDVPANAGFFDIMLSNPAAARVQSYTLSFHVVPHGATAGTVNILGTEAVGSGIFAGQSPVLIPGNDSYYFVTDFDMNSPAYSTATSAILARVDFNVSGAGATGSFDVIPVLDDPDGLAGTPVSSVQNEHTVDYANVTYNPGTISVPEPASAIGLLAIGASALMLRRRHGAR